MSTQAETLREIANQIRAIATEQIDPNPYRRKQLGGRLIGEAMKHGTFASPKHATLRTLIGSRLAAEHWEPVFTMLANFLNGGPTAGIQEQCTVIARAIDIEAQTVGTAHPGKPNRKVRVTDEDRIEKLKRAIDELGDDAKRDRVIQVAGVRKSDGCRLLRDMGFGGPAESPGSSLVP